MIMLTGNHAIKRKRWSQITYLNYFLGSLYRHYHDLFFQSYLATRAFENEQNKLCCDIKLMIFNFTIYA